MAGVTRLTDERDGRTGGGGVYCKVAVMALSEKDSELVGQVRNLADVLAVDPERYGQSVTTSEAVTAAVGLYVDAYRTLVQSRASGVRSEQETRTKDTLRQEMLNAVRPVYAAVQASSSISDTDKVAMGVHVKNTRHRPAAVPHVAPLVAVAKVDGSVVTIMMRNPEMVDSKARPDFADGIAVFAYVGDEQPTDLSMFRFVTNTGKTSIDVPFGPMVTLGTTVWLAAVYFNSRKQCGPASSPARATIGAGSTFGLTLKLAA